jgi:hypothetical protein
MPEMIPVEVEQVSPDIGLSASNVKPMAERWRRSSAIQ